MTGTNPGNTPADGGVAVGLAFDQATKYLYVSGGATGGADAAGGSTVFGCDCSGMMIGCAAAGAAANSANAISALKVNP